MYIRPSVFYDALRTDECLTSIAMQECMDVMSDLAGMREVVDMVAYRVTGRLSFDLLWEKNLPPRLTYVLGTMHRIDAVLHTYLGKRKGSAFWICISGMNRC